MNVFFLTIQLLTQNSSTLHLSTEERFRTLRYERLELYECCFESNTNTPKLFSYFFLVGLSRMNNFTLHLYLKKSINIKCGLSSSEKDIDWAASWTELYIPNCKLNELSFLLKLYWFENHDNLLFFGPLPNKNSIHTNAKTYVWSISTDRSLESKSIFLLIPKSFVKTTSAVKYVIFSKGIE